MRTRRRPFVPSSLLALLALLALPACGDSSSQTSTKSQGQGETAESSTIRIAVVPKGTTHEYWKSVHAGAVAAERDLRAAGTDLEVVFRGPDREDDREQQIALLENLQSGGFDAVVLAPLDEQALATPVRRLEDAGIPVVVIDSGVAGTPGEDFVSFIATDNERAGGLAGEHVAKALGGVGRVLLLRYLEGSESTTRREKGFIDAVTAGGGIELLDPARHAGATRATAQEAAENLLSSLATESAPGFDAVFCKNESSTYGMLLALRQRGLAGKVVFVGFDASPDLVAGLRGGEIDGLVVQDPIRMGRLGVEAAVAALAGTTVEPRIDTGAVLVLSETMNEARNLALLEPDLEALLGAEGR